MKDKPDVWQGTLALMVLKTLESMGQQHGYGIARWIERVSADTLSINHGTLYPGSSAAGTGRLACLGMGHSENNRSANLYRITQTGREQLALEMPQWEQ